MSRARLFLYGTLRDPDLFAIVSGRSLDGWPARLSGWRQVSCEGGRYPALVPGEGAEGLLVDVTDDELARLDFYETGFGYDRREASVQTPSGAVTADVWFPADTPEAGEDWSLPDWQTTFGPLVREAATEFMDLRDRFTSAEAAALYREVVARASFRLSARAAPSPQGPGPVMRGADVHTVETAQPFVGFFALRRDRLSFPRFGGGRSEVVARESLVSGDAVTVLPYDPEADTVLLLSQFRHGPFVRDDPNPWTLEPVAGRIDALEPPETTALREMEEEAGLVPHRLELMASYYPSPGPFSEFVISYLAIARLDGLDGRVKGLETEAEDILLHVTPFETLMEMVTSGVANTGTLVLSALWLARQRDRLRRTGFS